MDKRSYSPAEVAEKLGPVTSNDIQASPKRTSYRSSAGGGEWTIARSDLVEYLGSEQRYREVFEEEKS